MWLQHERKTGKRTYRYEYQVSRIGSGGGGSCVG